MCSGSVGCGVKGDWGGVGGSWLWLDFVVRVVLYKSSTTTIRQTTDADNKANTPVKGVSEAGNSLEQVETPLPTHYTLHSSTIHRILHYGLPQSFLYSSTQFRPQQQATQFTILQHSKQLTL